MHDTRVSYGAVSSLYLIQQHWQPPSTQRCVYTGKVLCNKVGQRNLWDKHVPQHGTLCCHTSCRLQLNKDFIFLHLQLQVFNINSLSLRPTTKILYCSSCLLCNINLTFIFIYILTMINEPNSMIPKCVPNGCYFTIKANWANWPLAWTPSSPHRCPAQFLFLAEVWLFCRT